MAEDDQQIAGWLLEHGYEFLWREKPDGEAFPEPSESEACWFEICRGPEVLSSAGPFDCPVSAETINATGRLIFKQALVLAKVRHVR